MGWCRTRGQLRGRIAARGGSDAWRRPWDRCRAWRGRCDGGSAPAAAAARAGSTRSDYDRPETIEETAELVTGARRQRRRRSPSTTSIRRRSRRWPNGSATTTATSTCSSTTSGVPRCSRAARRSGTRRSGSSTSTTGLRILRLGDRHAPDHVALSAAAARATARAACSSKSPTAPPTTTRTHYRISVFYDLAKVAVNRLAFSQGHELAPLRRRRRSRSRPGWLRSEMMLENVRRHRGRTGATRSTRAREAAHRRRPTSRCRNRRATSAAPSRRSPPIPIGHGGISSRSAPVELARRLRLHRHRRLAARHLAPHGRGPGGRQGRRPQRLSLASSCN